MINLGKKIVLLSALLLFVSCKKDIPTDLQTERNADQLLKDSIVHYYKIYSLWSEGSIPEAEEVYTFSDAYSSPVEVLNALKKTTPVHPGYQSNIDRFSYLQNQEPNPGFGLFLSFGAVSDHLAYPIVYFVDGGSSADRAGVRRSDVVLGVGDHEDLGIPVSCVDGSCKVLDPQQQQSVVRILLEAMEQNSMELRLRHNDGSESTVTISSQTYELNPVIKDAVFTYPTKNIGYLALSSFEDASEGHKNRVLLNAVFERFEQENIKDLILDLRYNTGGHVSTAEYLANRVVGAANDGALMYKYQLNPYMEVNQAGKNFEDVYFRRHNNLNLKTVYFLVTDITASASELLINVLRPYFNVVMIAEGNGTYGKPVGFFKQDIMGKTALWIASFKMVNANSETDYWDGIGADITRVRDDIFHDFGDVDETMLSTAVKHALGGESSSARIQSKSVSSAFQPNGRNLGQINRVPQNNMLKENKE